MNDMNHDQEPNEGEASFLCAVFFVLVVVYITLRLTL